MSKGSSPRPYSVSQDKFSSNWDEIFNKEKNMVMQTAVENNSVDGKCGCGRSPTGLCVGWHLLGENEYQARLEQYTQESTAPVEDTISEINQETDQ